VAQGKLDFFRRLDVTRVTRLTAPPYGRVLAGEVGERGALPGDDGLLLVGPLGVNYFEVNRDSVWVYLRRHDAKEPTPVTPPVTTSQRSVERRGERVLSGPMTSR
jgi:hypothetical protein